MIHGAGSLADDYVFATYIRTSDQDGRFETSYRILKITVGVTLPNPRFLLPQYTTTIATISRFTLWRRVQLALFFV